jgi:energy-coupling factor transporter transmembrane protein EcfT
MLSVRNGWHLAMLVAGIIIITIIAAFRTRNLPPKQEALRRLYYSFVAFGFLIMFLIFSLPDFYGFSYVPQEIKNLEEAQGILQEQSKNLEEMRDGLKELRYIIYLFLFSFIMFVLQSIYNFAKAVTPVETEKVLNLDSE